MRIHLLFQSSPKVCHQQCPLRCFRYIHKLSRNAHIFLISGVGFLLPGSTVLKCGAATAPKTTSAISSIPWRLLAPFSKSPMSGCETQHRDQDLIEQSSAGPALSHHAPTPIMPSPQPPHPIAPPLYLSRHPLISLPLSDSGNHPGGGLLASHWHLPRTDLRRSSYSSGLVLTLANVLFSMIMTMCTGDNLACLAQDWTHFLVLSKMQCENQIIMK